MPKIEVYDPRVLFKSTTNAKAFQLKLLQYRGSYKDRRKQEIRKHDLEEIRKQKDDVYCLYSSSFSTSGCTRREGKEFSSPSTLKKYMYIDKHACIK